MLGSHCPRRRGGARQHLQRDAIHRGILPTQANGRGHSITGSAAAAAGFAAPKPESPEPGRSGFCAPLASTRSPRGRTHRRVAESSSVAGAERVSRRTDFRPGADNLRRRGIPGPFRPGPRRGGPDPARPSHGPLMRSRRSPGWFPVCYILDELRSYSAPTFFGKYGCWTSRRIDMEADTAHLAPGPHDTIHFGPPPRGAPSVLDMNLPIDSGAGPYGLVFGSIEGCPYGIRQGWGGVLRCSVRSSRHASRSCRSANS